MLRQVLHKLFYDPARHARKLPFVIIGKDTALLPPARFDFRLGSGSFRGRISIGDDCMIGGAFVFESAQGDVRIGSRSFINGGTELICRDFIHIGSDVTIAWGCTIYDHNSHALDWRARAADIRQQLRDHKAGRSFLHGKNWDGVKERGIVIGDKVWIGFGVTILNGVHVGEGAVIGAGSVVRESVPPWTVVWGNPAVQIRRLDPQRISHQS